MELIMFVRFVIIYQIITNEIKCQMLDCQKKVKVMDKNETYTFQLQMFEYILVIFVQNFSNKYLCER